MGYSWLMLALALIHTPYSMGNELLATKNESNESGIYIIVYPQKKTACEHELRMVVGKRKVCISKKPIIPASEFEYVTDIRYDLKKKINYIDVGISANALRTLNKMVISLPQTQFAMVVGDDVVCLFEMSNEIDVRFIRVGEDTGINGLYEIRDTLKKLKF